MEECGISIIEVHTKNNLHDLNGLLSSRERNSRFPEARQYLGVNYIALR